MTEERQEAPTFEELSRASKALTLHRPWDYAILKGTKWVENRSWSPKVAPGWIFLHSGSTWADAGADMVRRMDGASDLSNASWQPFRIHGMAHISGFVQPGEPPDDVPSELAVWKEEASVGWRIDKVLCFWDTAIESIGIIRGAQRLWGVEARPLEMIRHMLLNEQYTVSSWRQRWDRRQKLAALARKP